MNNDELIFAAEENNLDYSVEKSVRPWKVVIADDENQVHVVTKMVLKGYNFEDRPIKFISTYSGDETIEVMRENKDIAVLLLDVVMEEENTGLKVVKKIREELDNSFVRIVLRTGQSGQAPERQVITEYDINDYKEKTDLTSQTLFTAVTSALRGYNDLRKLEANANQMNEMQSLIDNILKSMPSELITIDTDFKIKLFNKKAKLRFFNHLETDPVNLDLFETSTFFEKYRNDLADTIKNHTQKTIHHVIIENMVVNIYFFPVFSQNFDGVVIRIDDVTAIVSRDNQIKRIQKLETVGTLATGLAHDFNNILGGIVGAVSLIGIDMPKINPEVRDNIQSNIQTINQSVMRASGIVKQLLSLSRKQDFKPISYDLNIVIKNIYKICQNSFDKSIQIDVVYYPDVAQAFIDPSQIEQVILNLAINASHAMTIMRGENPYGGTMTIRVELLDADINFHKIHKNVISDQYWKVSITDTGVGIEKGELDKIFDPFYTTKKKDNGTGLGLSMVHNIIMTHSGYVEVESTPGEGTRFCIYLPRDTSAPLINDHDEKDQLQRGDGTILVCDDEFTMRKITTQVLELAGYKTFTAINGEEAVRIFSENQDVIDAIIMDYQMPKKSGIEAYREIKALKNDVKIILTSGLDSQDYQQLYKDEGIEHFISKPYRISNLTKLLHEILQ